MNKSRQKSKSKQKRNETPLQTLVRNEFRDSLKSVKAWQRQYSHDLQTTYELREPYYTRRQKATLRLIPDVTAKFGGKYDKLSANDLQAEYANLCATATMGYNEIDHLSGLIAGVAIWILDQLRQCGRLEAAKGYLPEQIPADALDAFEGLPLVSDCLYDDGLIYRMMYLLATRYGDTTYHSFTPKTTARDANDNFHRILDLIPEKSITDAVDQFRKDYWAILDLYLTQCNTFYAQIEKVKSKMNSCVSDIKDEFGYGLFGSCKTTAPFNLIANPKLDPNKITAESAQHTVSLRTKAAMLCTKANAAADDVARTREATNDFTHLFARSQMIGRKRLEKILGEENAKKFCEFPLHNPYETCFALLYLFDIDDDCVWSYGVSVALACRAASMLPWGLCLSEGIPGKMRFINDPENGDYVFMPGISKDWTEEKYRSIAVGEDDDPHIASLAQIIFEFTGYVLPRNMDRYAGLRAELRSRGLRPSQVSTVTALMAVLAEFSERNCMPLSLDEPFDAMEEDAEEIPVADAASNTEELIRENERLRKELAKLRESSKREVYAANKKAAELKTKLEEREQTAEEMGQELTDLRDIVFRSKTEVAEPEAAVKMSFPQHTKRRIVAFGGHDSWLREIKPKLPDVRFYGDVVTSPDVIRNADVVWIQANCIGHRVYYGIIDLCRKHNRKVRYFGFASTAKCAEQVIEEERKSQ